MNVGDVNTLQRLIIFCLKQSVVLRVLKMNRIEFKHRLKQLNHTTHLVIF